MNLINTKGSDRCIPGASASSVENINLQQNNYNTSSTEAEVRRSRYFTMTYEEVGEPVIPSRFENGDTLIFDLEREPKDGDWVAVLTQTGVELRAIHQQGDKFIGLSVCQHVEPINISPMDVLGTLCELRRSLE